MEKRFFIAMTLSILVFLTWNSFFGPPIQKPQTSVQQVSTPATGADESSKDVHPTATEVQTQVKETDPDAATAIPVAVETPIADQRKIQIDTPFFVAVLDTEGAHFTSWELKKHLDISGNPIQMISPDNPLFFPGDIRVNRSTEFNHLIYTCDAVDDFISVKEGMNPESINLTAVLPTGEEITKTFSFYPDNYLVSYDLALTNRSSVQISSNVEYLLPDRLMKPVEGEATNRFIRSGPVLWTSGEREIPKVAKVEGRETFSDVRWVANQESYFFAGLAPLTVGADGFVEPGNQNKEKAQTETAVAGLTIPSQTLNPGGKLIQKALLIIGPKKYDKLSELNIGIENIVDFGWIESLGKLFYKILLASVAYLKNYGLCIILLTVCVKLLLLPLSIKQMDSMKKMQAIQPQMKAIQEKYRKEPQKAQQELGKLYKTHGVNPMGGCLPMFIQFPIFIALYQVLMNLVEMRGASFMGINDLSQPNWFLVLLMGASMLAQQKLTPTSGDPKQARMMMMLPIVFTVMFWNFPAGLVLYWLTNNVLTIVQQIILNKGRLSQTEPAEPKIKARTRKKHEIQE